MLHQSLFTNPVNANALFLYPLSKIGLTNVNNNYALPNSVEVEYGGADLQHKLANCRGNCYIFWKIIIDFQKSLLIANHSGGSDRHFKYVLNGSVLYLDFVE